MRHMFEPDVESWSQYVPMHCWDVGRRPSKRGTSAPNLCIRPCRSTTTPSRHWTPWTRKIFKRQGGEGRRWVEAPGTGLTATTPSPVWILVSSWMVVARLSTGLIALMAWILVSHFQVVF